MPTIIPPLELLHMFECLPLQPYFLFICERVAPVYCSKSSWSTTSQCSTISSFFILYRSADLMLIFLFVGGIY